MTPPVEVTRVRLCGLQSLILLMVMLMPACAKTGRSYYTEARLALVRQNLERYDWARDQRAAILRAADAWARYDDARLRTLVVPPQVPRCYEPHSLGCPVHGVAANKGGLYKWGIDFDHPFKVRCPAGGEEYPSNDFAAYLASGMKDRALLTGDFPDDGWGFHKPGEKFGYWFVAYYAHWGMMRWLLPAIQHLGQAALLAPDPEQARRYAHKCALLLWQFAVHYPDFNYAKQSREGKEHDPNYTGKITNMIWEVATPNATAPAYDAVWPSLREDKELQQLAGLSGDALDEFIRERLLREAARCIMDGSHRIAGNYGMHQQSLVLLAAAMAETDKSPTTAEMINYVLGNQKMANYQDMGIHDALLNLIYRDGVPPESPGYSLGWVSTLSSVAEKLCDAGVDLYADRRFQRVMTWAFDLVMAGKFTPPLGDSGDMFSGLALPGGAAVRVAVQHMRDPRLDWLARKEQGAGRDLFSRPVDELLKDLPAPAEAPFRKQSTHFPGPGLAILQTDDEANRVSMLQAYGGWTMHCHADQLNLLLCAYDNPLLCDVGYPEQTDSFNHKRHGFWGNTVCHNTVVVDGTKQGRCQGQLFAFAPHGFAQVVDAAANRVYGDKLSLFRRANFLVRAAPGHSYVFDACYVRGGRQHDLVCMGPQADFTCTPPLGAVQPQGTLAGPEVPYEEFYDDAGLKGKPLGTVSCGGYRGSGFQFLFNVQRAPLTGPAVAQWQLTAPLPGQAPRPYQGIGLRAHLVGDGQEVIACDGRPQGYKQMPPTVKFLLRRRTGDSLRSAFLTVHEPYRDQPWIEAVTPAALEPADGQASAVLVTLTRGERHYLFHSLEPGRRYVVADRLTVDGQAACLVVGADGKPLRAMLLNGTELIDGELRLRGQGLRRSRITQVDYARGIIEVADPVVGADLQPGATVLVSPHGFAESVTLQQVVDSRHFSIGDEDLRVGGGPVTQVIAAESRFVTPVDSPHVRAGMTVLNSAGQVQGRWVAGKPGTLDRTGLPPLRAENFPAGADGLGPRFTVVVAGPGDEIVLPSLATYEAQP